MTRQVTELFDYKILLSLDHRKRVFVECRHVQSLLGILLIEKSYSKQIGWCNFEFKS